MRTTNNHTAKHHHLTTERSLRRVGYVSLSLIGLIGALALFPVGVSGADALDNTSHTNMTRLSVDAAFTISLSLEDNINMNIIPTRSGQFESTQTTLGVTTNNPEGYSLYLKTANGKSTLDNTRSVGGSIDSIASDTIGTNFTSNTWGYTLTSDTVSEATTFSPIPTTSDTPVKVTKQVSGETGDDYNLGFGARIDTSLPAGEYTNMIVASVIANPATITGLMDLVFMQDMTPEICEKTGDITVGNEVTKQLVDLRDGKKYWVSKLADGNCWMTQNLAFDLEAGTTLTPSTTDVQEDWLVPTSTEKEIPAKDSTYVDNTGSWNLGEIVLTNPTGSKLCPAATPPEGYIASDNYNSAWYGQNLTDACPEWYRNVDGMEEGAIATETSSIEGNKYDAHYLTGNYYQWGTATAGSGLSTDVTNTSEGFTNVSKLVDATSSICPKGWKLPTSGAYDQTIDDVRSAWPYEREDSFYNLLATYGYPETGKNGEATISWMVNNGFPYTSIIGEGKTRIDFAPLYATRSGYVWPGTGSIRGAGIDSFLQSSTAYPGSATIAYDFYMNTSNVYPAYNESRAYGLSTRCMAR